MDPELSPRLAQLSSSALPTSRPCTGRPWSCTRGWVWGVWAVGLQLSRPRKPQLPARRLWARPLRRTAAAVAASPGVVRQAGCLVREPRGAGPSPSWSATGVPFARDRAWEPRKAGPRGRCEVESELRPAGSGVLSKDPHSLRDPRRLASITPQRSLWLESPDS